MALARSIKVNVLTLNPGSSSLKFALYEIGDQHSEPNALARGKFEEIGGPNSHLQLELRGQSVKNSDLSTTTFKHALQLIVYELNAAQPKMKFDAVACRVVHAGSLYKEPTRISPQHIARLAKLSQLAPLHNPVSLELIQSLHDSNAALPVFAVFDSAFHATLPDYAYTYAIPRDLSKQFAIRRYGFHGISHRYIAERLRQVVLNRPNGLRAISCHLGSGSSICALRNGVSIDTSMGFTPIEGLVMGTRCGDLDPGVLLYLLNHAGKTAAEIDLILNSKSGLLALAGDSDMRALEQRARRGEIDAMLAMQVYAYRVAKYIGAYTVVLQGLDVIAFSGGIGENSEMMRRMICERLVFMGIELADQSSPSTEARAISANSSKVAVWVVPTDEELQLAKEIAPYLKQISAN